MLLLRLLLLLNGSKGQHKWFRAPALSEALFYLLDYTGHLRCDDFVRLL